MKNVMKSVLVSAVAVGSVTSVSAQERGTCPPEWVPLGEGLIWQSIPRVYAIEAFDTDGGSPQNPDLYVAGLFEIAGFPDSQHIAYRDGDNWVPCGSGLNGLPRVLKVLDEGSGPALYVGGQFSGPVGVESRNIARWDGLQWSALDEGLGQLSSNRVQAIEAFDDGSGSSLYAAGHFRRNESLGPEFNGIARWDGTAWQVVGGGFDLGASGVRDLIVFDDGTGSALYAAGEFEAAGGIAVNNIARWDGSNWAPVGDGLAGDIADLEVFDDGGGPALYAVGNLDEVGGQPGNYLARWDPQSGWVGIDVGDPNSISSMTVFDDGSGPALYLGTAFGFGGAQDDICVRWDGNSVETFGEPLTAAIFVLETLNLGSGPAMFAGGQLDQTCARDLNGLAMWGCSGSAGCSGDSNLDGQIDLTDLNAVLASFGTESFCGDMNHDGTVDLEDLNVVLTSFGTSCP